MKENKLSRRQFLGTTAAASTVYSLLPHTVLGANNRVNVGIIGVGGQGGGHMRSFNNLPDVNVIAVSDPDTDHMNKAADGVAKHRDLRNLLEVKDVDAVVIATPNHWHSLAAIMACQAGKHTYVEKPVSHSIYEGRKMVEAARKYDRIVQAGTQHRSCPGVIECAKDVQAGVYGKVLWAHCSKLGAGNRHNIGRVTQPVQAPSSIDYNLWAGPAPMSPIMRKRFHYDWHWQWNWGDGEMGNWGVHYIDDLRHILGWSDVPTKIQAAGNRWWDDDGETPNMHFCMMEHNGLNIVIDIRNLPDPGRGGTSGAVYLRSRAGNYIACEKGYIKIARGGGAAYDYDNKRIKQYKGAGGSGHRSNFINAIRKGSNKSLKAEIEIGHLSTVMCHQANIGYRVGKDASLDEIHAATTNSEDATNTLQSMLTQLEGNKVDLTKKPFILGPQLTYDNHAERFAGNHADKANALVNIPSRKGFSIPDKV